MGTCATISLTALRCTLPYSGAHRPEIGARRETLNCALLYEDQNVLVATVFNLHNALVMLRNVLLDKVHEIKSRIVRELEDFITYER